MSVRNVHRIEEKNLLLLIRVSDVISLLTKIFFQCNIVAEQKNSNIQFISNSDKFFVIICNWTHLDLIICLNATQHTTEASQSIMQASNFDDNVTDDIYC